MLNKDEMMHANIMNDKFTPECYMNIIYPF